jgi:tetratricopeptide (TPR) repeat protein
VGTRGLVVGVVALALLGASVVAMQILRERRFPDADLPQEVLYVTSPGTARRLALSFDALAADVYWMRAIQYFGGTRLSESQKSSYELLYPLLDLATSLDPYFSVAYRFGAFFLSEEPPLGPGRPDLSIRLLQKAIDAHPARWEYPYDVAFVYFRLRQYETAADWFRQAADKPTAPFWVRPLVGTMLTAGGNTNAARLVWRSLLESEVEFMRKDAARRLLQLDAIDQLAQLENIAREYAVRAGRPPQGWEDMIRAGMLRGIPLDPTGHPYVFDPQSGKADVGTKSALWPLTLERPS